MDNFKFSQDYELVPPQKQRSYPISTSEWTIIKRKILEIKDNSNFWHTLGSILIGVSLSTLVAALINDFKTDKLLWTCWAAFLITGISGALSFYFGRLQRLVQNKTKEDAIDFMTIIEERFQSPFDINTQKVNPSIIIHSAKYRYEKTSLDVTILIKELLANGLFEFKVSNELMGGDPFPGKIKVLELDCTIEGTRRQISSNEGTTICFK